MSKNLDRVVLITGASSGIGKACAEHLAGKGYRVYGTSRRAESVDGSEAHSSSGSLKMIPMDVTSDASVQAGIDLILEREGRLDVAVSNAGIGFAGSVEDTSIEEARAQFETNFFGTFRVCRAVLPTMRQQGQGTIVNISSIGGLMGIPFQGLYSASKFAIEGLTESLRLEVRPFGIRVAMIEPGDFHTQFTANRLKTSQSLVNPAYTRYFERALKRMEADETHGPSPDKVAHLLEHIITTRSPRLRYTVGPIPEQVAALLKRVAPHGLVEWGLWMYYEAL